VTWVSALDSPAKRYLPSFQFGDGIKGSEQLPRDAPPTGAIDMRT